MTQRCPPGPVAEWATQLRANSLRQGHPCWLHLSKLQGSGRGDQHSVTSCLPSLYSPWAGNGFSNSALVLVRQSQGPEWPCAPVTLSQMIHHNRGWVDRGRGVGGFKQDMWHIQMSGQQLCSIISQPWDSQNWRVGSRKGQQEWES